MCFKVSFSRIFKATPYAWYMYSVYYPLIEKGGDEENIVDQDCSWREKAIDWADGTGGGALFYAFSIVLLNASPHGRKSTPVKF